MAPRRVQPGRAKPKAEELVTDNEDNGFDFLASQSTESDDNEYRSRASFTVSMLTIKCAFRRFEAAFVERYAGMTRIKII
jgi:hypothetical protein